MLRKPPCCKAILKLTDLGDYILDKDYRGALEVARDASEKCPKFYLAWVMRAQVASDMAKKSKGEEVKKAYLREALESIDKAIELRRERHLAHLVKVRILMKHGLYREALEAIGEAEKNLGDFHPGEIIASRSVVKLHLGMIEEGLKDLEIIAEDGGFKGLTDKLKQEASGKALVNAGLAFGYLSILETDKGLEYAEKAVEEKATPSTLTILAFAYYLKEKYKSAINTLLGIEACGALDEYSTLVLTISNYKLGRYEKALEYAERGLAINPLNHYLNTTKCDAISELQGEEKGVECRKKWIKTYLEKGLKNNIAAWDAVAIAKYYEDRRNYSEAEKYFKLAIELQKYKNGDIYRGYGYLLRERLGRVREAAEYYKLGLKYALSMDTVGECAAGLEKLGEYLPSIRGYVWELSEYPGGWSATPIYRMAAYKSIKELMKKLRKQGVTCDEIVEDIY